MILKRIVIAGLMVYAIFYLIQSFIIIKFPYQISYPEGFILYQSYLISKGVSIYKTINEYPYLVANYPPLYQLLCASFVKLFGVSFVFGRLITFLASIIITWIIYKVLKEKTVSEIAVISALLFVSSSYIYEYSPLFRVDMLGLCFSLLGIYLFLRTDRPLIAAIFFVAALYTKPTFISAPLALMVYLFINERKRCFTFIIYVVLLYAIIFFLINYFTQGEFYRHSFLYNMNIFIFRQLAKYYIWFLQNHAILMLFSLIFLFLSVAEKEYSLYVIYFIISAVVALSVGKIGANMNYFFEVIAISCILTGLVINRLRELIRDEKISCLLINSALLTQLLLFSHIPFVTEPVVTRSEFENSRLLSEVACNTDGKIISEDAGLLALNNKPILFMPFEFTQLANQKLWDQTRFVDDVKRGMFSLIILSFDVDCFVDEERLTPEMVNAIKQRYIIKERIGDYNLYYPISQVE